LTITSISAVVAALGVIVGVVFAVLELRNLVKARQTDLVIRLYTHMDSLEFLKAFHKIFWMPEFKNYDDFAEKLSGKRYIASFVCEFFDGVSVLLRRKLIDISLVDDLLDNSTKQIWKKLRTPMMEVRKRGIDPRAYENFEYLYNEMKRSCLEEFSNRNCLYNYRAWAIFPIHKRFISPMSKCML